MHSDHFAAVLALRQSAALAPHPAGSRQSTPRRGALAEPVAVAVLSADPITGEGAAAFLGSCKGVKVLPADRHDEAEVVLIFTGWVTEETLDWMQHVADSAQRDVRFVLVGDGVREHHLLRAITCGLVSVIPRRQADFERILRAIGVVREARLEVPGAEVGRIVNQIRAIQQDVLEPQRAAPATLEARELEVLRLLADGLGTPEIAQQLSYSERTVKNIIHGVLSRWQLRNRAQAVAFALRNGAI